MCKPHLLLLALLLAALAQHGEGKAVFSVVFALIGRDVASELPYVLDNIARLHVSARFHRSHVILVENDSADGTRQVFDTFWSVHALPHLTASIMGVDVGGRGRKDLSVLGTARNVYLEAAKNEHTWADLLIAIDTDMCFPWDTDEHRRVLRLLRDSPWDALYANGVCGVYTNINGTVTEVERLSTDPRAEHVYCDMFAFRDLHNPNQHGSFDVKLPPDGGCGSNPPGSWTPDCEVHAGVPVVPVAAAFGGLGVYRLSTLRRLPQCVYGTRGGDCEHNALNACLRGEGAQLWLVPRLRVDWEGCSGLHRPQEVVVSSKSHKAMEHKDWHHD
jgi:hypothetical protein